MRNRSHDFDWDEFPVIGGTGSLHDIAGPEERVPRLAYMRSVSHAAAKALDRKTPDRPQHPIGFHRPKG